MCIHNILKNRGVWERIIHTRQHSYYVMKKSIRILPAGCRRDSTLFCKSTDGVTITVDLAKTRLPLGKHRSECTPTPGNRDKHSIRKRGSIVRTGLFCNGFALGSRMLIK